MIDDGPGPLRGESQATLQKDQVLMNFGPLGYRFTRRKFTKYFVNTR